MPYIKQERRKELDPLISDLFGILHEYDENKDSLILEYGDINYVISKLFKTIFEAKPKYSTANSLIGVLECVKLELYREQISYYEDVKKEENGAL